MGQMVMEMGKDQFGRESLQGLVMELVLGLRQSGVGKMIQRVDNIYLVYIGFIVWFYN